MGQDTVPETVDSILVKEGRVEITFIHSMFDNAMLFLSTNHDSTHIKMYGFHLVFRFLSRKHSAST